DRQLLSPVLAQALLYGPWVWAVRNAARVEGKGADLDTATAAEVAAHIIDHLIGVDIAVVVGHRHRLGMVIQLARTERADNEARPFKRLVDRRRLMNTASDRLEVVDAEGIGIEIAIPADHIQRVEIEGVVHDFAIHLDMDMELATLLVHR